MNRRGFLTALGAGLIVVPQFGRFYRQGAGTLWSPWRPMVRIGAGSDGPAGWRSPDTGSTLFTCRDEYAFEMWSPGHRWTTHRALIGPGGAILDVPGGRVKLVREAFPNGFAWQLSATEGVVL